MTGEGDKTMKHLCHAIECETPVPPKMFMCLKHWRMVPKNMQDAIWRLYRPGQEIDKNPSWEYLDATVDAMRFVREKEKPGSTILPDDGDVVLANILNEHESLLAQLETAQQQWISVREGLPEKQALSVGIRDGRYVNQQQGEVEVLITTNLGRVLCRRYTTLGFPNLKFGEGEEAIAWMPLPTPCDPKGE